MKFKLACSPRLEIKTNFGCMALSFQLTSIPSLLEGNIKRCNEREVHTNIMMVLAQILLCYQQSFIKKLGSHSRLVS